MRSWSLRSIRATSPKSMRISLAPDWSCGRIRLPGCGSEWKKPACAQEKEAIISMYLSIYLHISIYVDIYISMHVCLCVYIWVYESPSVVSIYISICTTLAPPPFVAPQALILPARHV